MPQDLDNPKEAIVHLLEHCEIVRLVPPELQLLRPTCPGADGSSRCRGLVPSEAAKNTSPSLSAHRDEAIGRWSMMTSQHTRPIRLSTRVVIIHRIHINQVCASRTRLIVGTDLSSSLVQAVFDLLATGAQIQHR